MAADPPTFNSGDVSWAQTVLFQALIVQLIESQALSVEAAQRVFDIALERAKKQRERLPDAERLIQQVHDNLRWDDFYRWAAERRKAGPGKPP